MSIKRIIKDIEQLEYAGELIDKNTPTNSRLALFLIDNLAELIMHREVLFEFSKYFFSKTYENWGKIALDYPYSYKKTERVKNKYPYKVNFLVNDLNILSKHDGDILKSCHYIRNEAYHYGVIRDNIIGPLVRTYFQTICKIYPSFPKLIIDTTGKKEFLRKYGIEGNEKLYDKALKKICQKISQGRGCKESELAKAISEHLSTRIQKSINTLESIADPYLYMAEEGEGERTINEIRKNMPNLRKRSPDEKLRLIQFGNLKPEDGGVKFKGDTRNKEDIKAFRKEWKEKYNKFRPKITINTLKKWLEKAKTLQNERNSGIILKKFKAIDKKFNNIEDLIFENYVKFIEDIDSLLNNFKSKRINKE